MALDDIRVLDLSGGPVGGIATTVLADFGADVVKVEPPGGDRFRSLAASPFWLRGKRSVTLALGEQQGRSALQPLIDAADVIVVAGSPARATRWGVDPGQLASSHPALVHCQITPWGSRGPLANAPGSDALVAAKSGRMKTFGRQLRGSAPGYSALPVAQHACAMGAVQGILAALLARERTGCGQHVETSLLQGLLPYDLVDLLFVQLIDRGVMELPDPSAGDMPTLNYHPVRAQDGRWIQCGNLMEHLFYAFLDSTDLLGELMADEHFQGAPAAWAPDVIEAARDRILLRVAERPADEWMERFRANGNVAAEPFLTAQEALDHPDLVANDELVTLSAPDVGETRQIGPFARLSATPGAVGRPAPSPGQHNEEVASDWTARPRRAGSTPAVLDSEPPLTGMLVADFSTIIAGPLATSMLADLGARVIKVEPVTGDPSRHIIPGGGLALRMNAGKESIALDLKSPEGRRLVRDLLARADVVVHNFRRGVPEKLGVDFESCREANRDVIWVAVQGYGLEGPDAGRPATHPVVGAAMGGATLQSAAALTQDCPDVASLREAARQIMRANEANPDPNTSSVTAAAVLLAAFARARGAGGQRVDVSMMVANAWANADDFLSYMGKAPRHEPDEALLGLGPGHRLYPAREGWVMLALTGEADWRRLAAALGTEARDEETLAACFAGESADDWEARLLGMGIPCVRADGPAPGRFWLSDPQVHANGFAPATTHERFGSMQRWGSIVQVGEPLDMPMAAPLCGASTDALLREWGHAEDEIRVWREKQIVASEEV
jgi:crotonobetainyl-CoA:carnitine CoA-transferase CaiB-like acyl-CoA transferase